MREREREREREQCVQFCPLGRGSNVSPSTPPCPTFTPPQAPSSLLEALEQHLASLEGRKLKDLSTASRYGPITGRLFCKDPALLLNQNSLKYRGNVANNANK